MRNSTNLTDERKFSRRFLKPRDEEEKKNSNRIRTDEEKTNSSFQKFGSMEKFLCLFLFLKFVFRNVKIRNEKRV